MRYEGGGNGIVQVRIRIGIDNRQQRMQIGKRTCVKNKDNEERGDKEKKREMGAEGEKWRDIQRQ